MKWFLFLLSVLGSLPCRVMAQPTQTARAEIQLNNNFRDFRVWPQPDSTVLVFKMERSFRRNTEPFMLLCFNQNLEIAWQQAVKVPKNSRFLYGGVFQKTTYLLFSTSRRAEFLLVQLNTRTRSQRISNHFLDEKTSFLITDLQALQGNLFITGLQNGRLVVFRLDPSQSEIQQLPAIYDQSSALSALQTDTIANRAEYILSESNGLRGRLQVKRLAPDGRLLSLSFLQDPQYNYLAGRFTPGDSATKLLVGTYSYRDLRYAQGFFAGTFIPGNNQSLKYHDFTSFSHYFDYMRPARQEKLKRKVARLRVAEKIYQLRQRMLLHQVYPLAEGFLLVGEQYYPRYQNEGTGKGMFDGYQFSQVVAAAIDRQGNLLWENSLPLQDVRTFNLREMITVGVWGKKVVLCHPEAEKLWYKELQNTETTPNDKFITIAPTNSADNVLSTYPDDVTNWYNGNLLTYGVQTLRGTKGFRTVYYLQKVSF